MGGPAPPRPRRRPYEALTADPAATLAPVLELFGVAGQAPRLPQIVATMNAITFAAGNRTVTRGHGVRQTRDPARFRYADEELFALLAKRAGEAAAPERAGAVPAADRLGPGG